MCSNIPLAHTISCCWCLYSHPWHIQRADNVHTPLHPYYGKVRTVQLVTKRGQKILTSLCQNFLTLNVKNWFWSSLWMPGRTHPDCMHSANLFCLQTMNFIVIYQEHQMLNFHCVSNWNHITLVHSDESDLKMTFCQKTLKMLKKAEKCLKSR